MAEATPKVVPIQTETDVVAVRQLVRAWSGELRMSLVDQTKLVTAASEIARNTLTYAGGGQLTVEKVATGDRPGLKLTFVDKGPGIANLDEAMRDGFTTGNGMGLGLGGARRLVHDFKIESRPGEGTTVVLTRWR